ncbi:MAG: Sapep family Mn(2+)-dependent dipeptidase [Clostridia bacterium]
MKATFENAVTALIKLLRINSVESAPKEGMPFGEGNAKALQEMLEIMASFGFKTKNIDNYCGWAEVGEGELFGVLTHLDVVPEGEGWSFPPFGAEIHNGRIYARGAMDDKGPAIASAFAAARLLQEGLVPNKRLRFIFGSDEESGWKCMDRYAQTEEMPVMGFSPDADFPVINCEKGIVYHEISIPLPQGVVSIKGGERANMVPDSAQAILEYDEYLAKKSVANGVIAKKEGDFLFLSAEGVSAHASNPSLGKNAIITLLSVLGEKYGALKKIYQAFAFNNGEGVGLKLSDEESGDLTLNLGTAAILDNNIVFNLDTRHPISTTKDQITATLKENLPLASVTQGFFHLPLFVPKDNPLVVKLLDAYNSVMGVNATPITIGGGTYARFLPLGVAFGAQFPGTPETIHQKDEYIVLEEFELMIEIYYRAIKSLCFE